MGWFTSGWFLRRGQGALAAGDLEGAYAAFRKAVDARPRWDVARLWLATSRSELGDLDGARAALAGPIERRPKVAVYRLWLGRILSDHGRYSEAVELFEDALEADPHNVHLAGYLTLARWAESGDETILEEIGWTVPKGGAELSARWLYEIENRFPGGPGTDFFVTSEPSRSPLKRLSLWRASRLLNRAEAAIRAGDHERALSLLERIDGAHLGGERAMELLIEAHRGAAKRRLKRLENDGHDVDLRLDAAEDLLDVGAPGDALDVLGPAVEHIESIDPNKLSWRAGEALLRGRALIATDQPQAASEALAIACELWSTEVEPLYYLSVALLRAGESSKARRRFIEACTVDSELAQIRLDELREATT